MLCPRCQFENYEGAQFCTRCGAPLTQKKTSPRRKGLAACLRALCYYMLFLGVQFAVIFAYEMAVMLPHAVSYIQGDLFDMESYYRDMMELVITEITEHLHIIMILSVLLTVLILFLSFHLRRKNPLAEMHIAPVPVKTCILALLFGGALQVAVAMILSLIPLPQDLIESYSQNSEMLTGGPIALQIVNVVLLTPVLEELIFRGLVFTRLSRGMRTGWAIALSAVIFGWAHGHIISFVYAGLLGVILVLLMRRHNNSVLAPIFCHMGFNGTSYLLSGIEEITLPVIALFFLCLAAAVLLGYVLLRPAQADADADTEE